MSRWVPLALVLLLSVAATAEDSRYAQPQPGGALSGKRLYISPGHGYYWDETYGWTTQRGVTFGLTEDIHTCEIVSDYLAKYLYNAGGTAFICRERCQQTREYIVDNGSAGYSDSGGWSTTANAGTGYGDGLYRYVATSATETAAARWTPTVAVGGAGWYSVYVWAAASANRVTDATFRVNHSGGTTEVRMNQRIDGSRWIWLGEYWFDEGTAGSVELSNRSAQSGVVIADAVRFGGGMGSLVRNGSASGQPRWKECARYWLEFMGAPSSVYQTRATDRDSDVTCRPTYADWQGGDAYVSLHTNAGGGTGSDTFIHDTAPSPGSAALQRAIHTQVVSDIRAQWLSTWTDRGMQTANFGEVRECRTMPAVLLELAFHDKQTPDNDALQDDDFRKLSARAIYKGIVRYFDPNATILPVAPTDFRVQNAGSGRVHLSWRRAIDPIEPSSTPTGYRVYRSRNGKAFEDGVVVASAAADVSCDVTGLAPGQVAWFRVSAVNAGGESFPTETLVVRVGPRAQVLIVDGFDRVDRYVRPREDENTFDYVRQHALAIGAGSTAFDSATNEAVADGLVALGGYDAVDWFTGEESTSDETLSSAEQAVVRDYIDHGGALLLSGSEIAWDLGANGSAQDVAFLRDVLHATYVADLPTTRSVIDGAAGSTLAVLGGLRYDDGSLGVYNVDSADEVAPTADAQACLLHRSDGRAAGVQWSGFGRLLYLTVPLEAFHPDDRISLMRQSLAWLLDRPRSRVSELAIGLGQGGAGKFFVMDAARGIPIGWQQVTWAAYNAASGVTRVACGDVDGDGRDEFVVGLGSFPQNGGFVEVIDDAGGGYAHLAWIRLQLGAYDASDGSTEVACGDVDGDGRAEIVVAPGRFPSNGGWMQVFDDASGRYAPLTWIRIPDTAYNVADGRVHPACGNVDGDAADEIVAGIGPYGADGGRLYVFDNAPGYAVIGRPRLPWAVYNAANGETRPSLADFDGDGRDEILVSLGTYRPAGGWIWIADDAVGGYATRGWTRLDWPNYNAADGQTWSAAGDTDGDGVIELAVGIGPYRPAGGWVEVLGGTAYHYSSLRWSHLNWPEYNLTDGRTRPAFARTR